MAEADRPKDTRRRGGVERAGVRGRGAADRQQRWTGGRGAGCGGAGACEAAVEAGHGQAEAVAAEAVDAALVGVPAPLRLLRIESPRGRRACGGRRGARARVKSPRDETPGGARPPPRTPRPAKTMCGGRHTLRARALRTSQRSLRTSQRSLRTARRSLAHAGAPRGFLLRPASCGSCPRVAATRAAPSHHLRIALDDI